MVRSGEAAVSAKTDASATPLGGAVDMVAPLLKPPGVGSAAPLPKPLGGAAVKHLGVGSAGRATFCGCGGDFHCSREPRAIFLRPQDARFRLRKRIASEPRFLLRRKWVKMALAAEFPAIPSSAVKNR